MKFDELDKKMRVFETGHDHCVLPGIYIVVRLDGRSFTKLTKEEHQFQAPYDVRFRDMMLQTVERVMNCGVKAVYGYTQSDEISILLDRNETLFNRKERKLNSVLAGEASAQFSVLLGSVACFDCRVSQLPTQQDVVDYFRWRHEDAFRNALNAHCYWMLRRQGKGVKEATKQLEGESVSAKNELLFQNEINFNNLPNWQKRGMGLYWEDYEKEGRNPVTGDTTLTTRRRIKRDMDLPMGDDYSALIDELVSDT